MELSSTAGDGVTGISQDSHGGNVYFSAAVVHHHHHQQQQLRGQVQHDANFAISSNYTQVNGITSSMYYAPNDQRFLMESSMQNGEKAIVAGETTVEDNFSSAEAGGTRSNPRQQSSNKNKRKPRKKKQTPIPKPGSTLEIPFDNLVQNSEQQQPQQQQQHQQLFHSAYLTQQVYSNSHQQTSNHTDILYGRNPMHQRDQMNPKASLPPLMNSVGMMYQHGIDEQQFNDMQNPFPFSSPTGRFMCSPHGVYSHPGVYNGHMMDNISFTQQCQQRQSLQNNSFETLIHAQKFQNLAHQPTTGVMNERITHPTVSVRNEETPVPNKDFFPTATAQPTYLPYSKEPAENSIHDYPNSGTSPTLTEASELKEGEIPSKPLAPVRPEKRLPSPPVLLSLRGKSGKNGKKASRPKKNKAVCTKKQKSKNVNKRSRDDKVRVCRGEESEEGKTSTKNSKRNQNLLIDDHEELAPDISVQLDAEDDCLIVSYDDSKHRYVNPLLEMPPFPGLRIFNKPYSYYELMLQSLNSYVCSADPANANEIWSISQIYFPRPDTFSLSYLAGLLGFRLLARHNQEQHPRQELRNDTNTESFICQQQTNEIQECITQETPCSAQNIGHFNKESGAVNVEPVIDNNNESELDVDRAVDKILTNQLMLTRTLSLENDPAMFIPQPSPYYNDGVEIDDSADVDDLDPVWRNIKQYYKGYNKSYFIPFTSVHVKNLSTKTEISDDIMKLAEDLKIIPLLDGSSISIRFATAKDDAVLQDAAFKKSSEYNGFRQLKDVYEVFSALKAPGEFIIVAFHVRNDNEIFLGCIHYCFHWYKLQDTPQQLSEASMYLNDVFCSTELSTNKIEKEALEVILQCQAFHHAKSCGIYYGMMHVSRNLSERYIHSFRMTELPAASDGCNSSMTLLAFSLSKCSYAYALRMFDRMRSPKSLRESGTLLMQCFDTSYRMLIRIPNHEGINENSTSSSNRRTSVHTEHASSVRDNLRNKSVTVRLNTAERMINYSSSCELLDEATKTGSIPWSVVGLFPQMYSIQPCSSPPNGDNSIVEPEVDEVHTELVKKQKQLNELESELEPRLVDLFRQVLKERVRFTSTQLQRKIVANVECIENYQKVLDRNKAAALAWQLQQEQDMDAVCDICNDGEVSVNNQILFCESCNVAVHQVCYNIETVPSGDWFCRACRYFNRHEIRYPQAESHGLSKKANSEPLPISCELCPRRQGAFVRTQNTECPEVAKWVHVVCAKWQGFKYLDITSPDCVESVLDTKYHFRSMGISCFLCKGMRGAYHRCDTENCERYMHMTCARSVGSCSVVHGETADGLLHSADAWKLKCPEHSGILTKDVPEGSLTVEELVESAKHFPSDTLPPPPPPPKPSAKNFGRMQLKERENYLKNDEFEQDLIREASKKREGGICEICYKWDECANIQEGDVVIEAGILWCTICGISVHKECYVEGIENQRTITRANFVCAACNWRKNNPEDAKAPQCNICNMKTGPLHEAYAKPASEAKWKKDPSYKKSLFGRKIWIHSLCALWGQVPLGEREGTQYQRYDCTHVVMSNGFSHIHEKWVCALCCRNDKLKINCAIEHCRYRGTKNPYRFHLTCANQAGFQLTDEGRGQEINLLSFCFIHKSMQFSIRSQVEDFLKLEKSRAGKNLPKGKGMSLGYFARLLQMSVKILAIFGWAWRWAEWWVEEGENFKSSLELDGQGDISSSSTPESRCADARRCRLAALGAALRNRDYDKEKGDDRVALDRALKAVLHTQSLVGPLKEVEIEFIAEWLGRAYRSNDRLLGFGEDKIPVSLYGETLHSADLSPKFELGCRPLPGKQLLEKGEIFESSTTDLDDFLRPLDPYAEVRGKKGRTTKTQKTEKKVESTSARVRFSKRSLNQSPSHEKELKSDHVTEGGQLGADDQPCTGRKIAVNHPAGKNPPEPTETTCNDDYPFHKKRKNPRHENRKLYVEPGCSNREKTAANLSDCLETTSKCLSYKENEASKKERNIDTGLSEKELRPSVESLAVLTSRDVIPIEVGKIMTTNSSHAEMNAFAEVHSEVDSEFAYELKKDGTCSKSSNLMETQRKRGRPKKSVRVVLDKSLTESKPETNLFEEIKSQNITSGVSGDDGGNRVKTPPEGLRNDIANGSHPVETREEGIDESKPIPFVVRPKTRRSYGSLPEFGQRDFSAGIKGRKNSLLSAKRKRSSQEPDMWNTSPNAQGSSVGSMVTTRSRSDINVENENMSDQHLSPAARLNKELEVHRIPRKKNQKPSRLTTHS